MPEQPKQKELQFVMRTSDVKAKEQKKGPSLSDLLPKPKYRSSVWYEPVAYKTPLPYYTGPSTPVFKMEAYLESGSMSEMALQVFVTPKGGKTLQVAEFLTTSLFKSYFDQAWEVLGARIKAHAKETGLL